MKKNILSIFILASLALSAQKNLISNGGFEMDAQSWNNESAITINPYTKHTGSKGGGITEYTAPQWKGIDQTFSIPKNTAAIEVSAWLKADGVEKGKSDWNKAVVIAEINGKGENIAALEGTTPWKEYKKVIPLNKDRSGRLMIALSECTGSFYFDDIKITPLTQEDLNKIQEQETKKYEVKVITDSTPLEIATLSNTDFENGLENWRGNAETTSEEKVKGQKSLKLSSSNPVWFGIDQIADIPDGSKTLDISAFAKTKDLKPGKNDWNKGVMIVEFTKDGTAKTGDDQPVFFVSDAKDWQKFSKTLTVPAGSRKYRIMLALSEATGTMYVDDIQVKFNK
ncbi:hypothetical protein [Chryseobacterium mucoviscidosis]|uniref:hypothetical protein n=1 Tax=Chryseobacterium mucoviscidosis TaxID=1945581 RepID=UPI0031E1782B